MLITASKFVGAASLVQALTAVLGIALARWMPTTEYAFYTIVMASSSAIAVLSTSGANLAFSQQLAKYWGDEVAITRSKRLVYRIRSKLALFVWPALSLPCLYLLNQNGAQWTVSLLLLGTALILSGVDLQVRQLEQILSFAGRAAKVQYIDTGLGVIKLAAAAGLLYTQNLTAISILSTVAASNLLRAIAIMNLSAPFISASTVCENENQTDTDTVASCQIVRRQIPSEVFACLQPQILLLALGMLGAAEFTAQYGALGRYAMFLAPFQMAINAYLIPRFALLPRIYTRDFIKFNAIASAPAIALTVLSVAFPDTLLLIVGEKYEHLRSEIQISCASASLAMIGGTAWGLMAHRGHNKWTWIQIPISILGLLSLAIQADQLTLARILSVQFATGIGLLTAAALEFVAALRTRNSPAIDR